MAICSVRGVHDLSLRARGTSLPVALLVTVAACQSKCEGKKRKAIGPDAGAPAVTGVDSSQKCERAETQQAETSALEGVEFGRAVTSGDSLFVPARGHTNPEMQSVYRLTRMGQVLRALDIGRGPVDGPLPRVAAWGDRVVTLSVAIPAHTEPVGSARVVQVSAVRGDSVFTVASSPGVVLDESQSIDLAMTSPADGLAVWVQTTDSRAVVTGLVFSAKASKPTHLPTPPSDVDVEAVRVFDRAHGYWLVSMLAGGASGEGAPSRADGPRWVEVQPLDAEGSPERPARKLPTEGARVVAFDAVTYDDRAALAVVALTESSRAGRHASLFRQREGADAFDVTSIPFTPSAEDTSVTLLSDQGRSVWAFGRDEGGHVRATAFAPTGEPASSSEQALDEVTPLGAWSGRADAPESDRRETALLTFSPTTQNAAFQLFRCQR